MKELLVNIIDNLMIFDLYHRIFNKNKLTVIMLHRIIDSTNNKNEWSFNLQHFIDLLAFIDEHYCVIKDPQQKNNKYNKPPLLITFDDGWYDNYQFAMPILAKMRFPWTLFIATGSINEYRPHERNQIASFYEIYDDKELFNGRQLGIKEINEMIVNGCNIGSHSHNHLPMTKLSINDFDNELGKSKDILKCLTSESSIPFSYPYGDRSDYTDELLLKKFYYLYTSDSKLNKNFRNRRIFNRIHISEKE